MFTVSEKKSVSISEVRLSSKANSSGGVISSVYTLTGSASQKPFSGEQSRADTLLEFMSSTSSKEKEMKVVTLLMASSVSRLISLLSSSVRLIVTNVEFSVEKFPPERLSAVKIGREALLWLTRVTSSTINVVISIVSENVKKSWLVSRSRSNETSVGSVVSGVKTVTFRGSEAPIPTTSFIATSSIPPCSSTRYVVFGEVATL